MSLKYSTAIVADRLTTLNTDIGASAKLRFYTGTRPANVNTAIGAQVLLSENVCNATAFGTVGSGVLTAGAISNGTGGATAGIATWYRLFKADGTTPCVDGDVVSTWAASTAYVVGQKVANSGNTYIVTTAGTSASSGGPTGTGGSITDGSVTWAYVAAGADLTLSSTSINPGQTVSVSSYVITGQPV